MNVELSLIAKYRRHLMKAFFYIAQDPTINTCAGMADSSSRAYGKLKACTDDTWSFRIDPPWIIPIRGKKGYFENEKAALVVGGEITATNSVFSKYNFFMSIIRSHNNSDDRMYDSCCEEQKKGDNRIVRRFHIDTGEGKELTLEPKSHVQFGGLCHEKQAIENYYGKPLHYCLDNKLDIPRMPYPPFDIILLLDLVLRQFETAIEKGFVEKAEWRKFVKGSEDFRLREYYYQIKSYYENKEANRAANEKTLFETLCDTHFHF
jgi:hypothetical protein